MSRAQPADPGAAVFAAIASKDHAALTSALAASIDPNALSDRYDRTPLQLACMGKDTAAVEILLNAGASPNATGPNPSGRPPLTFALGAKDAAITRLLLSRGAAIASRDSFGYTPFDIVFTNHDDACAAALFETMTAGREANARMGRDSLRAIDQSLCAAARAGEPEWCRKILDAGADINAIELGMYTPLMCAVIGRNDAVVALLLERGANHFVALGPGRHTALFYAISGLPDPAIVQRLLERYGFGSPELKEMDSDISAILLVAVRWPNKEAIRMLIEKGADPVRRDHTPRDLLYHAVQYGHPGNVEALLDAGLSVSNVSSEGEPKATHLDLARTLFKTNPGPDRQRIVELLERKHS